MKVIEQIPRRVIEHYGSHGFTHSRLALGETYVSIAELDGTRRKHYFVRESVGIAVGFLIAALHAAGLTTLTHSPAPMGFLKELLGRPDNERPFILMLSQRPHGSVI